MEETMSDISEEQASKLYDQVIEICQDWKTVDEHKARLIVELSDDAIREFGNTNQEKKVELRKIKAQAEIILPPSITIEDLRKRAEGQLLQKSYPKSRGLRNALLIIVALTSLLAIVFTFRKVVTEQGKLPEVGSTQPPLTQTSPNTVQSPPSVLTDANDASPDNSDNVSNSQTEKPKSSLTRLEAETLIQRQRKNVEQCISGLEGCMYLDFAFSHNE